MRRKHGNGNDNDDDDDKRRSTQQKEHSGIMRQLPATVTT